MKSYDVVIVGSGPGGYVAAIRSAQLGKKTAIVEKYNKLGGTCLNVGCIPSKSLLDSSHLFEDIKSKSKEHGIGITGDVFIDFKKMIERKNAVVSQTCEGIDYLMKKNKIDVYNGIGSFKSKTEIVVSNGREEKYILNATNTIIATGSKPASLPFVKIDKKNIITSTEALSLKEIPKHLMIIGGGVIGLELGQVYNRLGAKVSVFEYEDRILPTMDASLSKELTKVLKKSGFKFYLNTQVISVDKKSVQVTIKALDKNDKEIQISGDYCLVSIGRRAYTDSLGLANVGIKQLENGQIETNENLQTSQSNIYAIGDVVKGAMLAHKAEEEGVFVVEHLVNQKPHINYALIPSVVYTWPEVASVGVTENYLKEKKIAYKLGQFPFRALGRSRASMEVNGFVKILADAETDEVLGMHIIGARAADLITEGVTAMEYKASAEDIARICHAHPTYSEAIKEAALATTENRAIHM